MNLNNSIPLNEFITLQRGFDLPSKDRVTGNIPVVASTSIVDFHNTAKAIAPGVVIGRSGSIGGGQYIKEDYWPLNTTLWVKDFKGHNPRYIYYVLKNINFSRFNVGSGVPTLNRNHLSTISISDIGLLNENKIAHVLSTLDDKIELNRKMNKTLEEMAQALFKSWFVDFDPVHAKAKAKGSDADLEKIAKELGISKEVLDLFPDEFEESEIGMIPKGWEVKKLLELTNITSSKRIFSREYEEDGIPFYRSKEIIGLASGNAIEDTLYISENKYSDIKEKFLVPKKNDILITSVGTIGIIYLVPDNSPFYFKDGNLTWINGYNNIHHLYIYHFLKSTKTQNRIKSVVIGTTQKALTIVNINSLSIITPTINILEEFSKQAEAIFKQITINTNLTHSLQKTRDTLLPKLLSGELDVLELNLEIQ